MRAAPRPGPKQCRTVEEIDRPIFPRFGRVGVRRGTSCPGSVAEMAPARVVRRSLVGKREWARASRFGHAPCRSSRAERVSVAIPTCRLSRASPSERLSNGRSQLRGECDNVQGTRKNRTSQVEARVSDPGGSLR